MSVPKVKRNESTMQFIENARQLEIYIIKHVHSFSRKKGGDIEYEHVAYIWNKLADYSVDLLNSVLTANKVFIARQEDVERRSKLFDDALFYVNSITAQLHVLKELYPEIKAGTIGKISELSEQEKRLIVAVKKSDRKFLK